MTFLPNQQRPGLRYNPLGSRVEVYTTGGQTAPTTHQGSFSRGLVTVHVLRCDKCGNECHNEAIEDYEDYLPDGWGEYADGTHKCPDCRTQRAIEREMKFRESVVQPGMSPKELRALVRALVREKMQGE